MAKSDRCLLLRIETDGLTLEQEDALAVALLRVADEYGAAHVELPLPLWVEP
jgi:hypothetical protein